MPERVFVDTNLFLRYLTNDVPEQADAVETMLERAAAGDIVLVTNTMTIAEIVWVLESFYEQPRDAIRERILAIVNTPGLTVENEALIVQAIVWYAAENVDFIDAYNAAWLLANDMTVAYTFDRRHFARIEDVTVRVPGEDV